MGGRAWRCLRTADESAHGCSTTDLRPRPAGLDHTLNQGPPPVTAADAPVPVGNDAVVHVEDTATAGENVPGSVEIFDGATSLGTAVLTAGEADVTVDSSALAVGPHTLTAKYATTTNYLAGQDDLVLTVGQATPTLVATVVTGTYGKTVPVKITVTGNGTPTGVVAVRRGTTVLGQATLVGGTATVTLPAKSVPPGNNVLSAVYSGDTNNAPAVQAFNQVIAKATSAVAVKVKPGKIKKNKTTAKVKVTVSATGVVPTGKVKVKVKGEKAKTVTLKNGKATAKFGPFGSVGKKKVTVKYLGDTFVSPSSKKVNLTVTV